jgi:glutathione S-transferase
MAVSLNRMYGLEPDLVEFEKQIDLLDKKLDVYDAILSKQKYLAGDVSLSLLMQTIAGERLTYVSQQLTVVDIFHLFHGEGLGSCGSDIMTRKPNVAR